MRLTVGPLPPAVYWRRRVVVLGAGVLLLVVLLYSCNGPSGRRNGTGQKAAPTPTSTSAAPAPGGTPLPSGPGAGASASADPVVPVGPAGPGEVSTVPQAPAAGDGACGDTEISVRPTADPATAPSGGTVELHLEIKNVSQRTCSRDVGADMQELFIKAGADKVWSSDTCGQAKGSDIRSFTPGFAREYTVVWNGRNSTKCANGLADGPPTPPGEYQVFGRLGTKLSDPVKLVLS